MNSKGLMLGALAMFAASMGEASHGMEKLEQWNLEHCPSRNPAGHGSKRLNSKASNKRKSAKKARKRNRK